MTALAQTGSTIGGKQTVPGSSLGRLLRNWQRLYRGTPNFRGKGRVLFDWPSRLVRGWPADVAVRSREGCVFLHCDLNDFLYRQLFFFGLHEIDVDWLCQRLLRPGDTFVDIGACYGYHSLTAAGRVGPRGTVYAIEPQRDVFEILEENVRYNGISNVEVDNLALSNRDEYLQLYKFSDLGIGHTSTAHLEHPVSQVLSCAAMTFDRYLAQKSIPSVTLVKLDVEGAELKVLHGASALLGGPSPPMWVIEVNMETAGACGYDARELFSLLSGFGYQAYRPVWGHALRQVRRVELCPLNEIEHGRNMLCAIPHLHADSLVRVGAG